MSDERTLEEIEVVGARRRDQFHLERLLRAGFISGGGGEAEPILPEDIGLPAAFVAPPAVQAIDEIIVRAKAPRPPPTTRARLPRAIGAGALRLLGLLGLAVGATALLEGERKRRQAEEDALARAETELRRQERLKRETLRVLPQPEVIPEVIVTAKRQLLPQVLPWPQFPDPDADPFFSPTVEPRFLPETQPAPEPIIEVEPVAPPMIPQPARSPHVTPYTFPIPEIRPLRQPMPRPDTMPQPEPVPRVSPSERTRTSPTVSPQPRSRRRTAPATRRLTQPQPQPLPFGDPRLGRPDCPPCPRAKEEEKKPRLECYKKLVKEGLYPDMDESFNWVQIDCITGRELS